MQGGEFQRPWKRCSMVAKWPLEVEIAMGKYSMFSCQVCCYRYVAIGLLVAYLLV